MEKAIKNIENPEDVFTPEDEVRIENGVKYQTTLRIKMPKYSDQYPGFYGISGRRWEFLPGTGYVPVEEIIEP